MGDPHIDTSVQYLERVRINRRAVEIRKGHRAIAHGTNFRAALA